jgi:histidine ammonia-lyase
LNYLLNDKLNGKLPAFINTGTLGLNFGMQGIQYTATSTVAENQALSTPLYIHSIPSNNDNQDLVSMGSNAALMCARVIDNTYEVLTIHALAVVEAIDCLGVVDVMSPRIQSFHAQIRAIAPRITSDTPMYQAFAAIKEVLMGWENL